MTCCAFPYVHCHEAFLCFLSLLYIHHTNTHSVLCICANAFQGQDLHFFFFLILSLVAVSKGFLNCSGLGKEVLNGHQALVFPPNEVLLLLLVNPRFCVSASPYASGAEAYRLAVNLFVSGTWTHFEGCFEAHKIHVTLMCS